MDKQPEVKLCEAIEKILPVVSTLKSYEWTRIVSIVNYHYSSKAAKVMLDGNDMGYLEKHLRNEILGEPYRIKAHQ